MKKYHIAILASILVLSFGSLAFARHGGFGGGPMGGQGGPGMHGPMMLIRTLERLDLTKVQKSKIAMLLKTDIDKNSKNAAPMREEMQALRLAVLEGDKNKVRKLSQTMSKKHEAMMLDRTQLMNNVRAVLTPEQSKQLVELTKMRMDCFNNMRRNNCPQFGQGSGYGQGQGYGKGYGFHGQGQRRGQGMGYAGQRDGRCPVSVEAWIDANM
ncbi:Spy/CpxP family protein refolding chaperone [Pseudodesulfovibrio senegalensis]|jgi:Spy/CpxP family protein refolding chaperone|nr:Spy/CpxP family protein refolding chaperone [Pseudodesulfovibrio senegalensis]